MKIRTVALVGLVALSVAGCHRTEAGKHLAQTLHGGIHGIHHGANVPAPIQRRVAQPQKTAAPCPTHACGSCCGAQPNISINIQTAPTAPAAAELPTLPPVPAKPVVAPPKPVAKAPTSITIDSSLVAGEAVHAPVPAPAPAPTPTQVWAPDAVAELPSMTIPWQQSAMMQQPMMPMFQAPMMQMPMVMPMVHAPVQQPAVVASAANHAPVALHANVAGIPQHGSELYNGKNGVRPFLVRKGAVWTGDSTYMLPLAGGAPLHQEQEHVAFETISGPAVQQTVIAASPIQSIQPVHRSAARQKVASSTIDLAMRKGPSFGAAFCATIPRGQHAALSHCEGAWCKLTYNGQPGWASKKFLRIHSH